MCAGLGNSVEDVGDGTPVPAVLTCPVCLPAVLFALLALQVCSSVASGYSGLGESASQISAAASRAASSCRRPQGPASCAGSTTSSALLRIAALEKQLAAAKSESAQLRAMVGGKGPEA